MLTFPCCDDPVLAPRTEITSLINKAYKNKHDIVQESLDADRYEDESGDPRRGCDGLLQHGRCDREEDEAERREAVGDGGVLRPRRI